MESSPIVARGSQIPHLPTLVSNYCPLTSASYPMHTQLLIPVFIRTEEENRMENLMG